LLPPESGALEVVAHDVGIGAGTLARWRDEIQAKVTPTRGWTADARLDAVITTAAMDEVGKSAWCREHGVFRADLDAWRATATAALGASKTIRPREHRVRSCFATLPGVACLHVPPASY